MSQKIKIPTFDQGLPMMEYLSLGWTVVSPTEVVCPSCRAVLIRHPSDSWFMYCPSCHAHSISEKYAQRIAESEPVVSKPQKAVLATEQHKEMPQEPSTSSEDDQEEEDAVRLTLPSSHATQSLGSLLLRGYRMCAESCPEGCNQPLAQAPNNGEYSCTDCGWCGMTLPVDPDAPPKCPVDVHHLVQDIVSRVNARMDKIGGEDEDETSDLFSQQAPLDTPPHRSKDVPKSVIPAPTIQTTQASVTAAPTLQDSGFQSRAQEEGRVSRQEAMSALRARGFHLGMEMSRAPTADIPRVMEALRHVKEAIELLKTL
eukprot:gnl/Dysnectes_brevis/2766_a3369_1526.p1 GENE.gnl/Dysnectes_brevis/2766_a3369_1526~~gnl/Dysnectes_brevis/2766_a3369_1526.p1  ORF type:complete len:330 (-),score=66.70 gnl/Dysnectes_brevis/2766_a3369_1526:64-1005(-)